MMLMLLALDHFEKEGSRRCLSHIYSALYHILCTDLLATL